MSKANTIIIKTIFLLLHLTLITNDNSNNIQYDPFAFPTDNYVIAIIKVIKQSWGIFCLH